MPDFFNLSIQEKEQLMQHLATIYRRGKRQRQFNLCGMIKEYCDMECMDLASQMQLILQMMLPCDALLLENDFFEQKEKNWWKDIYSSKMYQERKRIAMEQFLRCLYV